MRRVALLGLLLFATTGCSLAFVKGPPTGHQEMTEFTCTDHYFVPIFEGVFGALLLYAGLGSDDEEGLQIGSEALWPTGALMLTDAAVGALKVNKCRDALEELRHRGPSSSFLRIQHFAR